MKNEKVNYQLVIVKTNSDGQEEVVFEIDEDYNEPVSDAEAAQSLVKVAWHGMTDED